MPQRLAQTRRPQSNPLTGLSLVTVFVLEADAASLDSQCKVPQEGL